MLVSSGRPAFSLRRRHSCAWRAIPLASRNDVPHCGHLVSVLRSGRRSRMPFNHTSYGMERHNFSWFVVVPC